MLCHTCPDLSCAKPYLFSASARIVCKSDCQPCGLLPMCVRGYFARTRCVTEIVEYICLSIGPQSLRGRTASRSVRTWPWPSVALLRAQCVAVHGTHLFSGSTDAPSILFS